MLRRCLAPPARSTLHACLQGGLRRPAAVRAVAFIAAGNPWRRGGLVGAPQRVVSPGGGVAALDAPRRLLSASVYWDEGFEALADEPNAFIIDVRNSDELLVKSVDGAHHVPCTRFDDPHVAVEAAILPEDKAVPIVVFCAIGFRSGRVVEALRAQGYTNVANGGGIDGFKRATAL
eukprot:NODE_18653_length_883_cov_2.152116.p1 GENE.NODE_18653_length_883_cov_2.152116~~NODE_18653_length_883_cov_2.152116.p1  ORF type:complete len:200 (-),score=50.57 NODE_18653_length_883_cov_2.152116:283-810(-)